MKGMNLFRIAYEYARRHIKSILMFFMFSCVFAVVLFLGGVELTILLYAFMICAFIALLFALVDFIWFAAKHKRLVRLQNQITVSIAELPTRADLIERDLCALVKILFDDKRAAISSLDVARGDMMDYYTLWAHQIKTPIAAMHLILQSDEYENSDELEEQLFKIEQYVEMVLSYIRLDSSVNDFVLRKYSLDGIVKSAVRKYAKLFIRKKLPLEYEETNQFVVTDEKWMAFVIEQVLSNSLKYTGAGRIKIHFEGGSLIIEDSGMGISPDDLPRVFEKGYTGYNGRSDKKSSGIGLYLCKKICGKIGATIDISSEVGRYTRVTIGFPADNIILD